MSTRNRWIGREKPPGVAQVPSPSMLARNGRRTRAEYYIHVNQADNVEGDLYTGEESKSSDWKK